jgi:hypothetical protein
MFAATFYFLGGAGCILAAMVCLTKGRRVTQRVEVDLSDLKAASVSLLMAGKRPSWDEMRGLWMQWYARCQAKAFAKQQSIYSWARTLVLCAAICLIGIVVQVELDEQVSISRVWENIRATRPVATHVEHGAPNGHASPVHGQPTTTPSK